MSKAKVSKTLEEWLEDDSDVEEHSRTDFSVEHKQPNGDSVDFRNVRGAEAQHSSQSQGSEKSYSDDFESPLHEPQKFIVAHSNEIHQKSPPAVINGGILVNNEKSSSLIPLHAVVPTENYKIVEVMLCDRGCQTVTEVACQTDPDACIFACPSCYKDIFGHGSNHFCGCCCAPSAAALLNMKPLSVDESSASDECCVNNSDLGNQRDDSHITFSKTNLCQEPCIDVGQCYHRHYKESMMPVDDRVKHKMSVRQSRLQENWKKRLDQIENRVDRLLMKYQLS